MPVAKVVEKTDLLPAMGLVEAVVEVDGDGYRLLSVGVQAVQIDQGEKRTENIPKRAAAFGTRNGRLADRVATVDRIRSGAHAVGKIVPELVGIVGVGVAAGNQKSPATKYVGPCMGHASFIALVGGGGGKALHNPKALLAFRSKKIPPIELNVPPSKFAETVLPETSEQM